MSLKFSLIIVFLVLPLKLFGNIGENLSMKNIPTIGDVHRQALAYAGLEPGEMEKMRKRSKLSAILPVLQVDYARRVKNDVDVTVGDSVYVGSSGVTVGPTDSSLVRTADNDQNVGVKATWRLNEIIFNRDSLEVSREARSLLHERQTVLDKVNANYFERQKFIHELDELMKNRSLPAKEKKQKTALLNIQIEEKNADLDAMTGGWFGEQVNR